MSEPNPILSALHEDRDSWRRVAEQLEARVQELERENATRLQAQLNMGELLHVAGERQSDLQEQRDALTEQVRVLREAIQNLLRDRIYIMPMDRELLGAALTVTAPWEEASHG